jgi:hypothetical protein
VVTSWTARVRTPNLALIDPIEFSSLTLVENYLGVDMLAVEGRSKRMNSAMIPGNGIYLVDGTGRRRFSGDLIEVERRGNGTCTLMFAGDDFLLRSAICWPVPSAQWSTAGQSGAYDVRTASAETRALGYINANVGPGARSERRVARLRVPTSGNRGPSAKSSARFQTLADFIAPMAESAGLDIGVLQTFDGNTPWLDVTVTPVPDMSAYIRFGTAEASGPAILGEDWSYKLTRYAANVGLSAAGGEKQYRNLNFLDQTSSADSTVWANRRIERFVDQRGTGELPQKEEDLAKAEAALATAEREVVRTVAQLLALDISTDVVAVRWNSDEPIGWAAAKSKTNNGKAAAQTAYNDAVTARNTAQTERNTALTARNAAIVSDLAEIMKGLEEELLGAAGTNEIAVPITSTPTFKLGVDAPLGSRVSAVLDGIQIKERIRQITTVVSSDGPTEKVSAIFGSPDVGPQSPTQKALKAALKRLEKLEKI